MRVAGLTDVKAVACGTYHSLALKNDGTAWAWGYNNQGQLGDGTTTDRWTPVQVAGLTGVTALAAGGGHSLFATTAPATVAPGLTGTWPATGGVEESVRYIIVGFDIPVTNVSTDDLVLAVGTVTGVQGSGQGPYVFAVTGLPFGSITASLDGDIATAAGGDLPGYQWTFRNVLACDVDGNGHVDVVDLLALIDSFGLGSTDPLFDSRCDFNGDGSVDVVDLLSLVDNFGI